MPPDELGPDGALDPVAQIGAGERHSCALTVGGKVRCWGKIDNIGNPAANCIVAADDGTVSCLLAGESERRSLDGDLGPVTQLAAGRFHSCALTMSGQVHCWGNNAMVRPRRPRIWVRLHSWRWASVTVVR